MFEKCGKWSIYYLPLDKNGQLMPVIKVKMSCLLLLMWINYSILLIFYYRIVNYKILFCWHENCNRIKPTEDMRGMQNFQSNTKRRTKNGKKSEGVYIN